MRLTGPPDAMALLIEQLPAFFDRDADELDDAATLDAELVVTADAMRLDLPDGLGLDGPPGAETLRSAASQIELAMMDHQRTFVVLHAGAVALHGRAVLLPGTSMAGKSTLVRALVDLGAVYLSDEYALLGPDGMVSAYPRLMTTRLAGGGRERTSTSSASSVDAAPIPVALVAGLRWEPGAGWSTETASPAQTVMTMMANCVNARRDPERALDRLSAAATGADSITGTRGEADQAARMIADLVMSGT